MFTLQGGASWSTVNDLFHAGHRQSFVFWGESVYLSIHTYNIKSPYYDRKVFFYNILHKFSSRNFRSWLFDVVILVNWLRSNKLPCFHLYLLSPYHPCENMFQCSRTVLDFPELFQNYANHDFQNFFPWTVIEPASRALLEQIKDFANPIFVLEQ